MIARDLTSVREHIVELEGRIAKQRALLDRLVASGRDINPAICTLRVLSTTLALTREHLDILKSVESRRKQSCAAAAVGRDAMVDAANG